MKITDLMSILNKLPEEKDDWWNGQFKELEGVNGDCIKAVVIFGSRR